MALLGTSPVTVPSCHFPLYSSWTAESRGFFYRVHSLQFTQVLNPLVSNFPVPWSSPNKDGCISGPQEGWHVLFGVAVTNHHKLGSFIEQKCTDTVLKVRRPDDALDQRTSSGGQKSRSSSGKTFLSLPNSDATWNSLACGNMSPIHICVSIFSPFSYRSTSHRI